MNSGVCVRSHHTRHTSFPVAPRPARCAGRRQGLATTGRARQYPGAVRLRLRAHDAPPARYTAARGDRQCGGTGAYGSPSGWLCALPCSPGLLLVACLASSSSNRSSLRCRLRCNLTASRVSAASRRRCSCARSAARATSSLRTRASACALLVASAWAATERAFIAASTRASALRGESLDAAAAAPRRPPPPLPTPPALLAANSRAASPLALSMTLRTCFARRLPSALCGARLCGSPNSASWHGRESHASQLQAARASLEPQGASGRQG